MEKNLARTINSTMLRVKSLQDLIIHVTESEVYDRDLRFWLIDCAQSEIDLLLNEVRGMHSDDRWEAYERVL